MSRCTKTKLNFCTQIMSYKRRSHFIVILSTLDNLNIISYNIEKIPLDVTNHRDLS